MEKQESNLDGLHQDLAKRFGALSQLFGQLGSPRAVQELLDGLTSEDGTAFKQFVDRVDFPMLGKCFWLRELVERVLSTPSGLVPGDCWLRDNLTPQERQLYLQIAVRHRSMDGIKSTEVTLQNGHRVIPPGPFLDELKTNRLVTCDPSRQTFDTTLTLAFSRPELVCV